MGLIQTTHAPRLEVIPLRRWRRNRSGLGANNTVSDPQALIQAEQNLAARGIEANCYEEVLYGPTGPVYNRICTPVGSGTSSIGADLFTSDKPSWYLDRMAQIAAEEIARDKQEASSAGPTDTSWLTPFLPINQPSLPNYAVYQQAITDSAAASAAARQAAADAAAQKAAQDAAAKAAADAAAQKAAQDAAAKAAADAAQKAQADSYSQYQAAIAEYNARMLADALARNTAVAPIYAPSTGQNQTPGQPGQPTAPTWKETFGGSGSRATAATTAPITTFPSASSIFTQDKLGSIPTWAYLAAAGAAGLYLLGQKKGR